MNQSGHVRACWACAELVATAQYPATNSDESMVTKALKEDNDVGELIVPVSLCVCAVILHLPPPLSVEVVHTSTISPPWFVGKADLWGNLSTMGDVRICEVLPIRSELLPNLVTVEVCIYRDFQAIIYNPITLN